MASHYAPSETLYVRNRDGELTAEPLRREAIAALPRNSVRKLYLDFRQSFYDSLMGGVIIIPEGTSDHHWLSLWHRVAEASPDVARDLQLTSLTFLPTADAAVADAFREVSRFREDAVPLIDGDAAGDGYLAELLAQAPPPKYILRYGKGASIECVSAWILEPTLASPGPHVADLMRTSSDHSHRRLQEALIHSKKDRELHECLAWPGRRWKHPRRSCGRESCFRTWRFSLQGNLRST